MNRSTKGALAAAAAGTLLLGGAGTLAYWTADTTVSGGTINAGSIALATPACAGWKHANGDALVKIVPGDTVTNSCTTTLTLVGDRIGATLTIDPASIPKVVTPGGDLDDELTASVQVLDANNAVVSSFTTPGVKNLTAKITVTFPYGTLSTPDVRTGAKNGSQNGSVTLDALKLIAVQTNTTTP